MYLDSAYVAKYYVNERDSDSVRRVIIGASSLFTSEWSSVEVVCAFHRHFRQGSLSAHQYGDLWRAFREHIEDGLWSLVPINSKLLARAAASLRSLPTSVFLRSGDAIQLVSAQESGGDEIWTSDRHILAAAGHFGLKGRPV